METIESLVGIVVDDIAFTVERGKIREFQRATSTCDPVHHDRAAAADAGYADVLATPTHVVVAGHYRDQSAFVSMLGLDIARIVVGSVTWEFGRPVVAGDELRGIRVVVADEVRQGRRGGLMRIVTLETPYCDATGTAVVTVREELIERGASS
ncbi:MAG: MaoC domain protein dehydratase [Marmoricola sp.]|nr:MaoC domain protein dehydratase [Marmoricola sp.]